MKIYKKRRINASANKSRVLAYIDTSSVAMIREYFAREISNMKNFLLRNKYIKEAAMDLDYYDYTDEFNDEFINEILMNDNSEFKDCFFDDFSRIKQSLVDDIFGDVREEIYAKYHA